jgi:hypothetical protein
MKHKYQIICLIIFVFSFSSRCVLYSQTPLYTILISTSMGDMKAILYAETPVHSENFIDLDYAYTVFGEVISGIDVIDKIASVQVDINNRSLEDIRLNIKILEQ